MHPLQFEGLAQEHIENLLRQAANQRLVPRPQKRKARPGRAWAVGLQRAPTA